MTLTAEKLRSKVKYDADTGLFYRIMKDGSLEQASDKPCGSHGYRALSVCGTEYLQHRLAWLYHYGEWPKQRIDHINEDKMDNRIENLRDVSAAINALNRSQTKGYRYQKDMNKWVAQVGADCTTYYIGCYDTMEEAIFARQVAVDFILAEAGFLDTFETTLEHSK